MKRTCNNCRALIINHNYKGNIWDDPQFQCDLGFSIIIERIDVWHSNPKPKTNCPKPETILEANKLSIEKCKEVKNGIRE
jgi:hypothetical protein